MKSVINRAIASFVLLALTGAAAFAKTRMGTVTFSSDIKVNGTLVKKGEYELKFDEKTNELSVEKGGKVVVKTAARIEKLDRKVKSNAIRTIMEGMEERLVSISFSGSDQSVVVSPAMMQAGG